MDRAALRIEHAGLEADVDPDFHRWRPFAGNGTRAPYGDTAAYILRKRGGAEVHYERLFAIFSFAMSVGGPRPALLCGCNIPAKSPSSHCHNHIRAGPDSIVQCNTQSVSSATGVIMRNHSLRLALGASLSALAFGSFSRLPPRRRTMPPRRSNDGPRQRHPSSPSTAARRTSRTSPVSVDTLDASTVQSIFDAGGDTTALAARRAGPVSSKARTAALRRVSTFAASATPTSTLPPRSRSRW